MTSQGECLLENIELRGCDAVPFTLSLKPAVWTLYQKALLEVLLEYRDVTSLEFQACDQPWLQEPPLGYRQDERFTDNWGCVWHNTSNGLDGQIIEHPLDDWSKLDSYTPPDPLKYTERGTIDFPALHRSAAKARVRGQCIERSLNRCLYERVRYLRGDVNFFMDIGEEHPNLKRLIDMVTEYNMVQVTQFLDMGATMITFGDYPGMQDRLAISPYAWRKFFMPSYRRMISACRRREAHVHFYSSGCVVEIMDDMLEAGVSLFGLDGGVNSIQQISEHLTGRIAVQVELDRQHLLPKASPQELDEHIMEIIRRLGSPQGGLFLKAGIYPDVPLENIRAVLEAIRKYRTFWTDHA